MSSQSAQSNFSFLPTGALIQEFNVEGYNIVQSFDNVAYYKDAPYFGETIGRTCNRISNATIESLNGKSYKLAANNGPNSLHGGNVGWGKRTFQGPVPEQRNGKEAVKFTYVSPDGEEGYPGTVDLRVWYTAWEENVGGTTNVFLEAEYEVELIGDECEETAVSVTNHSYFTLSGGETIEGTEVTLSTVQHQPVDEGAIPLGTKIEPYPGIEAGKPFTLGKTEPAIDHCFILDPSAANIPVDTRSRPLKQLVTMSHPSTGLHLEISSTEPAFQYYTGQFVDVPAAEGSAARPARAGICVEPSRYVNAINNPEWKSQMTLKRGEKWGARSVYKAWKA